MKTRFKGIALLITLLVAIFVTGCGNTVRNAVDSDNQTEVFKDTFDGTTLIIYYSYSGTTQRVAEHLQQITGGELYELTLEEPYSGSSNDVSDRVFADYGWDCFYH